MKFLDGSLQNNRFDSIFTKFVFNIHTYLRFFISLKIYSDIFFFDYLF